MDNKRYFERGGLLASLGAFIGAVPQMAALPAPAIVASVVTYTGIGVGSLGLVLVLIPLLPVLTPQEPTARRVKRNDLKSMYAFCGGIFGDNFSSFNNVKRWFKQNEKMFWIVERVRQKGPITVSKITGFYSIIPLTNSGVEALHSGQIDGRGFFVEHIAKDNDTASAFYIGAIGSKGTRSKGIALGSLITNITQILDSKPRYVYTRPTTRDGLRLARQRGFEAVDGSGTADINKLYFHDGNNI